MLDARRPVEVGHRQRRARGRAAEARGAAASAAAARHGLGEDGPWHRPPARPDRAAVRQARRSRPDRRVEPLPRRAARGPRGAGAQRQEAEPALRDAGAGTSATVPPLRERPGARDARLRLLDREQAAGPLRAGGRPGRDRLRAPEVTTEPGLRRFGRSVLPVSRLGLGLAALGRPGYINLGHGDDLGGRKDVAALERNAHTVLDAAFEAGVRYFDAARSYGRAEEFLAFWLDRRGLPPGAVTVGSKWGYTYTAGWQVDAEVHEVKDLSLANLRRQLVESRGLLGPHLRLYQIHSATEDSGVLDDPLVLDELARLRETGLAIGLTVTGPTQRETIERALEVGIFDTAQATWNLLERSASPALAAAHAAGLGVIVKEAHANGRLTARGGEADDGP